MSKYILIFFLNISVSCAFLDADMIVNHELADLSLMFHRGLIKESSKMKVILEESGYFDDLEKTLIQEGYGYRIKDSRYQWKLFEDNNHLITIGTAYRNKNSGYGFVLVEKFFLEEEMRNFEVKVKRVFYKFGSDVRYGKKYPKNIIPYKTLKSKLERAVKGI